MLDQESISLRRIEDRRNLFLISPEGLGQIEEINHELKSFEILVLAMP